MTDNTVKYRQLFGRIGDEVRQNKRSILAVTHWLTDVWMDPSGQVWVKLLSFRELRRSRHNLQEFEEHFRFVVKQVRQTSHLQLVTSDGESV